MDEWLDEQGLYRKNNALDGTCLFRAVAEQLMPANPVTGHLELRKKCVKFMKENRAIFESRIPTDFDEYLENLANPKAWAGVIELYAISLIYEVDFEVFHGPEDPLPVTENGFPKVLLLCVTGDTFYDAVYKKTKINDWAFCQSIVYNILYEKVFKLEDLDYAVDKMLHDKAARAQRERYLSNQSVIREDNDLYLEHPEGPVNVRQIVDSGAILFPYKVAKALDPDIFRNTEFDNWVESHRGKPLPPTPKYTELQVSRRNNFWFGNGGHLRVGVRCHVRVDDRILTGHIQEMAPDNGPVTVYVEELSKKLTVSYDCLIPVPRGSLRPDWSYSHKHQMISKLGSKDRPDECSEMCRRKMRNRKKDECASPGVDAESTSRHIKEEVNVKEEVVISEADSTVSSPGSAPPRRLIISSIDEQTLVNTTVPPSTRLDGSDLPYDDPSTLRFFYNMGLEYYRRGSVTAMKLVNLVNSPDEFSPTQMITGAPIYQAATQILPHPDPTMTPGVQACQGPPLISPLPPSPIIAPVPVSFTTPISIDHSPPKPLSLPPPREVKERGRNSKFTKPPRFQRLETSDSMQTTAYRNEEEVQQQEITSTSGIISVPRQFNVPPPPLPPYPCQAVTYTYPMEGEITCEQTAYGDPHYSEVPAYFSDHLPVPHVTDGPTAYVESHEVNYQVHYPYYAPIPVYYS